MIVYNSVASYFCTPLNRKINVGTLIAKYEYVRRLVIVFSPGTEAIEYEDAKTTDWFDQLQNNAEFFNYLYTQQEDVFGNVVGVPIGAWMNNLSNPNMRQMPDGTAQWWDFGLNAWVIPVLVNGVMEYHEVTP